MEQIPQFLKGFLLGLPIWGVLGWLISRALGPSVDELGFRLKGWFLSRFSTNEYSTYVAYTELERLISALHTEQGYDRFTEQKTYLDNHAINFVTKHYGTKQLRDIAETWIQHGRIWSYAASDIFFAGMELLLPQLTKENVQEIFNKHHANNQASLWPFLETVEEKRPELLSATVLRYLRDKQQEYEVKLSKRRK